MVKRSGAYYSSEHSLYHNHSQVMGTRLDVIFQGQDMELSEKAFEYILSELKRLDRMMNRYDPYSQVSMINKLAGLESFRVEKELFDILLNCREYHQKTSGLFDISLGKATDLIKSTQDENIKINISNLLNNSGMESITFNPEDYTIHFNKPEVSIDLGGYGKGYALDNIKRPLESLDISNAFISFGNSSVLAMGDHPAGEGWKAGIQNIFIPTESVHSFELYNESLSTSGSKSMKEVSSSISEIVHPKYGILSGSLRQICVKSFSSLEAEVLSTSLFAADTIETQDIMTSFPDSHVIIVDYDAQGGAKVLDLKQ